jgi:hypothetical protein
MPRDPGTSRAQPAPAHPAGYAAVDDGPGHVAPPVDVRPGSISRTSFAPPAPDEVEVPFALPVPVEEIDDHEDRFVVAPVSAAPATIDWELHSHHARAPDDDEGHTLEEPPPTFSPSGDDDDERQAILRDLSAIGPLEAAPDRDRERPLATRTPLARARALRFRLAVLDAWSRPAPASATSLAARALDLDLALDGALLVAIADGAPSETQGDAFAAASALVEHLRALRPELSRTTIRDRGAASIARLTIVGYRDALGAIASAARTAPPDARAVALELSARAALEPALSEIRLDALHDLERALGLPLGSVAPAIDAARDRLTAPRGRANGRGLR